MNSESDLAKANQDLIKHQQRARAASSKNDRLKKELNQLLENKYRLDTKIDGLKKSNSKHEKGIQELEGKIESRKECQHQAELIQLSNLYEFEGLEKKMKLAEVAEDQEVDTPKADMTSTIQNLKREIETCDDKILQIEEEITKLQQDK